MHQEMGYCTSGITLTILPTAANPTHTKPLIFPCTASSNFSRHTVSASVKRNDVQPIGKKVNKVGRRLVRISTAEGRWQGNWKTDYSFSLRDLRLDDLLEDGDPNDARVFISLSVHKALGFRLMGRLTHPLPESVATALPLTAGRWVCLGDSGSRAKANKTLHATQITTNFSVWVLSSNKDGDSSQIPEIGSDDPSVIYVKPGCEADLDSLIQDTIRLTTSVNETCSDFCAKSGLRLHDLSKAKAPTIDKRWSKLLELKNSYQ